MEWSQDGGITGSSTHIPHRNINFNNYPQMRIPLWEPGNTSEKFQHLGGAKILRTDCTEEGIKKCHFSCVTLPSIQHSWEPRKTIMSFKEKVRAKCAPSFPNLVGYCSSGTLLSHPNQSTEGIDMTEKFRDS